MTFAESSSDIMLAVFAKKVEAKLAKACEKHGVKSPDELSRELASEIFSNACTAVAAENFPEANVAQLSHGLRAFQDRRFWPAVSRVRSNLDRGFDAFAFAEGIDIAIVMAGFGLQVVPIDRRTNLKLGDPSNFIGEVYETFSKFKTARVGYSPCDLNFYIVLTDCINSFFKLIGREKALHELKEILDREGYPERRVVPAFRHGMILLARKTQDTPSLVFVSNPKQDEGSVGFYAGHKIGEQRIGVPNEGFIPVPLQFVAGSLDNPETAAWLWRPSNPKLVIH
jgi:hypothetical protein